MLLLLSLLACADPPEARAESVTLYCSEAATPLRVRVPEHAVVQTYLCSEEGRCSTIDHTLDESFVELRCASSPAKPRMVRWIAPGR